VVGVIQGGKDRDRVLGRWMLTEERIDCDVFHSRTFVVDHSEPHLMASSHLMFEDLSHWTSFESWTR
jgi:hypothetical protein